MRVVRLVTWLVLLVTTCSTQAEEDVDYTDDINGSTIWTIYVTNIQSAISDLINEGKVTPHSCLENEEAGYVKDEDKEYVVQSMDDLNLDYNITQTEVVTQMKEERATCSPLFCPTPFMYSFMTQLQISYFLNAVVSSSPRVTVKTIGTTIYGRNIQLVHLAPCKSDNPPNTPVNPNPSKPIHLIQEAW
ncbi:uncharacterized protein LOC122263373 [Penaeus japonicus]|uniref:uncharacterized protein LOC122263373 n=1 Tax=Penaeus japonicus TaxID=27405 RepID=UPI001C7157D2|nr:uncharacterized protein LOC122263373 [Penaeus japonicus]